MKSNSVIEAETRATGELNRREILTLAGSGLFVLFSTQEASAHNQDEKIPERPTFPTDFNAYLRVGSDGKVTGFAGKVELGQGSRTVLSQLIADELDVEYDAVEMVMVDTSVCPWDMGPETEYHRRGDGWRIGDDRRHRRRDSERRYHGRNDYADER